MQLPYSWIKELVDILLSPEELADKLTLCGAEAEIITLFDGELDNIVVGHILELEPVPDSDHLKKAVVDTGREKLQVVCGAPNVQKGQKVAFAGVGVKLKVGEIKKVKLRGVESFGMICSEAELGLTDDHSGIIVLEDDAPTGQPLAECLGLNDKILKLDLTPNRADLLSAIGVARDVACLTGKKIKRPEYKLEESAEKAFDSVKISIADPEACPRYAARIIKNVKMGQSPWWIKKKLLLCGIRPISNIVDISNLVMLEYGEPLHAFDYDRFGSREVVVRRARDGEKFVTLDGKEHTLDNDVLMITNGRESVAVGGIMGGLYSEVEDNTQNVLLEAAHFNARVTRRGRQKLGFVTEASTRFERGTDPNIIPEALNRAAFLMQKYAGGEVCSGIVDCYPKEIHPDIIKLRPERVNALLGTNITRERMVNILKGLEFGVVDKEILEVAVPTFCADITREVDLIEEIVRIEGYAAVPDAERNSGPLFSAQHDDDIFRADIRRVLTAQGFDEMYSPGLADSELLAKVSGETPQLKVLNPIAEDLTVMQNSLIYSLLKAVSHNIAHRNINLRLFDIGRIYLPGNPPVETEQIGLAVSGKAGDEWYQRGRTFGFHDLKGAFDSILESSGISPLAYEPTESTCFADSCSYNILLNNEKIGYIGEIKERMARLFDIKQTVLAGVIDFEKLIKERHPVEAFKDLPRFPAAPRDLAIVVDEDIQVGRIIKLIKEKAGPLLEKVELFDLFRGKQIGAGKKSLAFSMIYRSPDGSLESEDITAIHDKIADELKNNFNAEIREAG